MKKIEYFLLLPFLFSSATVYSVDWQTTAVVSIASSYLGCAYFKKKLRLHSSQFWKDVTKTSCLSFVSGRCFEWWLLSQAGTTNKALTDSTSIPANFHSGNSENIHLLYSAMPEVSTICGMRTDILTFVVPAATALVLYYLNSSSQFDLQKNQLFAAEAQQNREHRFQKEQAERSYAFQVSERHNAEQFAVQVHEKQRQQLERTDTISKDDIIAEELFMDQFRMDPLRLKDRSSLGYIPEELQKWLSDFDNETFEHQHLLLSGYAGSGKSHSMRVVAHEIKKNCEKAGKKVELFMVRQARIAGRHMHETMESLERFFNCVERHAKQSSEVIILWDEIDVLTSVSLSDDSAAYDINSTVGVLKEILDPENLPKNVRILATTNRPDSINNAIKSRFKGCCELTLPNATEREELLRFWVKDGPSKTLKIWKKYAQKTSGWSLRDLQKFFDRAQKLSNGFFDKKWVKCAFQEGVKAKEVGKQDFSKYESGWDKTKQYAIQGVGFVVTVASNFVSGGLSTLGGCVASWWME